MEKNYLKPMVINEQSIDRKLVYAEAVDERNGCNTWVKNDITNNERVV